MTVLCNRNDGILQEEWSSPGGVLLVAVWELCGVQG